MASSMTLSVNTDITSNITSSLTVSPDYKNFAVITRELSTNSSQWIYKLDFYDFGSLKKLDTADIYLTYDTDKHFASFIPSPTGDGIIAVTTVNNLIFYSINPLSVIMSILHRQSNVYDLTASPDGELVVLVGQSIVIYRTIGFNQIVFPQIVQNARYCDFSMDGLYMVIASTGSINLYTFTRTNDDYQFEQVPLTTFQAPVQYGSITSIQFNPSNSSELLVGYLSSSPGAFSIQNGGQFFQKMTDIQPMSSQNAKIAKYMPDSQRFYSFDYLDGVGIWPGLGDKLYYLENFLLYDASSNAVGTRLIGYVWQQIKVVDIALSCSNTTNATSATCPCPTSQTWNYATYSCSSFVCLQAEYATGVVQNNACQCISGFVWNPVKQKCTIDCSQIEKALPTQSTLYECYCGDNWSWNAFTRSCVFDCTQVPYSSGVLTNTSVCACLPGFIWNAGNLQCECPVYMAPSGSVCLCYSNYYLSEQNICTANCSIIQNAVSTASNPQECVCSSGYYFSTSQQQAGCQLNCSAISNTVQQYDFNTCLCREHMDWLNNTCVVDCSMIQYSDASGLANNTCACAINYNWNNNIKECARNCQGVAYTDPNGQPTLQACPCIQNFLWSQTNTQCEIQCDKIPNSQEWSLTQSNQCQCRSGFVWNSSSLACQVDCGNIWNANARINDSYCSCSNNQAFDNTTLTCASASAAGVFSSTLSIVGFVIGCVVALIILIILVRFCWKFKTEGNQQHQKKIKSKQTRKKKNKMLRQEVAPPMMEDELKTDQRILSPTKIKTGTTI